MPDRIVKTTLIIDEFGAVKSVRSVGEQAGHTEAKLEHLGKNVEHLGKRFSGLRSAIGYGLSALGVGGAIYGLKDVVSSTEELGKATEKFHALSNIAPQQSLDITAALKARGLSPEIIGKSFGFLNKNLQGAERQWHTYHLAQLHASEGGKLVTAQLGTQAQAFKELGLNVGELSGLSAEQKLQKVVGAFENLSPALRKSGEAGRLMKQIFGKGGEGLATVLVPGALGLTAMTKAAREFFPTLNVHSLEELHEQTAYSNLAFEGLKFTLGQQLIPVILDVDRWFIKTIRSIKEGHGGWGTLERDIEKVVSVGRGIIGFFEHSALATKALKIALIGLGAAWGIEKLAQFVRLIKELTIVQGIAKGVKALAAAEWGLAGAEGAAGAGGVAGAVGGIGGLAKFAGVAGLAYGAAEGIHAVGKATGIINEGKENEQFGDKALAPLIRQLEAKGAAEGKPIHVHVNMDGKLVAEAIVRNPHANRRLTEGVAHETSKYAARR